MSLARLLSCLVMVGLAAACSSSGPAATTGTGTGSASATNGGSGTGATTGGPCTAKCPGKNQACAFTETGSQTCGCKGGFINCPPSGSSALTCLNKNTDNNNCGTCGNACVSPLTCSGGTCGCNLSATVANCPDGQGGHVCADLTTDPNHCGGCANVCGPDATCVYDRDAGGAAACVCNDQNLSSCSGACVDETSDANNCGCCGNVCMPADAGGPATTCLANGGGLGLCQCQPPWAQCAQCGGCVDTDTDVNNCGLCGNTCVANGAPVTCDAGNCFCGADGMGIICPDGSCPDMLTDVDHCGGCNIACASNDAGAACIDGHCFCGIDAGGIICPSGACSDLIDDPRNCGICGHECFVPNPYCVDAGCAASASG